MTTELEDTGTASFYHRKNIQSGLGRILFAKATTPTDGLYRPEGWVMPGGIRTNDAARAKHAAEVIDVLSRAALPKTRAPVPAEA